MIRSRRGSTLMEFTLVAVPLIFLLISVEEVGRGMWTYHALAHAVNEGVQYAAVRGMGCAPPNACGATVADIVERISRTGNGLDPRLLDLTLTSTGGDVPCSPMSNCQGSPTGWPPANHNQPGTDISIAGRYTFRTALAMFWPGAGSVRLGTVYLSAGAGQQIQF